MKITIHNAQDAEPQALQKAIERVQQRWENHDAQIYVNKRVPDDEKEWRYPSGWETLFPIQRIKRIATKLPPCSQPDILVGQGRHFKMESRFPLVWMQIAIKDHRCVIINSHGELQLWGHDFWKEFLPE